MRLEDLARELAQTKLALAAAQTALSDIERICEETQGAKIQSGESVTFRTAEPEFRLNSIQRRLAQYRLANP